LPKQLATSLDAPHLAVEVAGTWPGSTYNAQFVSVCELYTKANSFLNTSKCNWGSGRLRRVVSNHEPWNNTHGQVGAHRREHAILVGAASHFFHRPVRHISGPFMGGLGHSGIHNSHSGHKFVYFGSLANRNELRMGARIRAGDCASGVWSSSDLSGNKTRLQPCPRESGYRFSFDRRHRARY
jgi:hypothetical protein